MTHQIVPKLHICKTECIFCQIVKFYKLSKRIFGNTDHPPNVKMDSCLPFWQSCPFLTRCSLLCVLTIICRFWRWCDYVHRRLPHPSSLPSFSPNSKRTSVKFKASGNYDVFSQQGACRDGSEMSKSTCVGAILEGEESDSQDNSKTAEINKTCTI